MANCHGCGVPIGGKRKKWCSLRCNQRRYGSSEKGRETRQRRRWGLNKHVHGPEDSVDWKGPKNPNWKGMVDAEECLKNRKGRARLYHRLYARFQFATDDAERETARQELRRYFPEQKKTDPATRLHNKKQYAAKYRESHRAQSRVKDRERREQTRLLVIDHYSNGTRRCACCGEGHVIFLTIDHVDGSGWMERRGLRDRGATTGSHLYRRLLRSGFPAGYQVLCWNCNWAKGTGVMCPHKIEGGVDAISVQRGSSNRRASAS